MADLLRLDGKVAVVVGGAGGIGEALSYGLAQYGAKVAVCDILLPKAEQIAADIKKKSNMDTAAFQFDITSEQSVADLVKNVLAKFGTVDILVNAHGMNVKSLAVDFKMDQWDKLFAINVRGTFLTCREFGKVMLEKKKGKIINLSSVRGSRATDGGNCGYAATKGAVDMITRTLAIEWAKLGVNVNALAPSLVMTEGAKKAIAPERIAKLLTEQVMGHFGTLDDLIGGCIYLASPASDFVTGHILYIDGGLTAKA